MFTDPVPGFPSCPGRLLLNGPRQHRLPNTLHFSFRPAFSGVPCSRCRSRHGRRMGRFGLHSEHDAVSARAAAPGIDWREGSAGALPLRDGEQFDAVICQQGLQFFPDKPAAAAQMRRALKEGGKLAVSTWRSDEEVPFFRALRRLAEAHLGPIVDPRYGYGDAGALEALLREAGFREVRSRKLTRTMRFDDGLSFVRMNAMALVGMSAAGKAMDGAERQSVLEAIVGESAALLRPSTEGALVFELGTNLATARG